MKREVKAVVPLAYDKVPIGTSLKLHKQFTMLMSALFGGITSQGVEGAWVDAQGNLISEQNVAYTVAVDDAEAWTEFANYAEDLAKDLRQDALYLVGWNGIVEIRDVVLPTHAGLETPALPAS